MNKIIGSFFVIILLICLFSCSSHQKVTEVDSGKSNSQNVNYEISEEPTHDETTSPLQTIPKINVYIVNCNTNKQIKELKNNDKVDLLLYGPNISLEVVSSAKVGSMKFDYDKKNSFRIDNVSPYAIYNEKNGDFEVMNFSEGKHLLKISLFSQSEANGEIIASKEINFTINNSETARENVKKSIKNTKTIKSDPLSFKDIDSTEEVKMRTEVIEIALAEVGYNRGDKRPYMEGAYCWAFLDWVYKKSSYKINIWNAPKIYTSDLPENWVPKPGDLIKYHYQHYAMVEKLNSDGTISTIEGNFNNAVVRNDHWIKDWKKDVSYFQTITPFAKK